MVAVSGDALRRLPLAADGASWWERHLDVIITIAIVVVAAMIVTLIVRRVTRRFVDRLVRRNEERIRKAEEQLGEEPEERSSPIPTVVTPKGVTARLSKLGPEGERFSQRAQTLGSVLRNVATVTIWVIAVLIILGELNISVAPLLASAGVLGVALGFGAQVIVGDILVGMFMIMEDQFGVGDVVDMGEAVGVVEEVTLRVTRLRDVEGTVWYVRNGQVQQVGNMSQLWARVILDIGVAYDTDIEEASKLIKRVADDVWHEEADGARVLEEPSIWGLEQFGADAILIRLAVKTRPGEQWAVARRIRAGVKTAFDEAGIDIPFPQRSIWVNPVAGGSETSAAGDSDVTPTPG